MCKTGLNELQKFNPEVVKMTRPIQKPVEPQIIITVNIGVVIYNMINEKSFNGINVCERMDGHSVLQ